MWASFYFLLDLYWLFVIYGCFFGFDSMCWHVYLKTFGTPGYELPPYRGLTPQGYTPVPQADPALIQPVQQTTTHSGPPTKLLGTEAPQRLEESLSEASSQVVYDPAEAQATGKDDSSTHREP